MKKIAIPLVVTVALLAFGWCGGNIWADWIREQNPVGFDIGTRLTYQTRGVAVGGASAIVIAPVIFAWLRSRETRRKK